MIVVQHMFTGHSGARTQFLHSILIQYNIDLSKGIVKVMTNTVKFQKQTFSGKTYLPCTILSQDSENSIYGYGWRLKFQEIASRKVTSSPLLTIVLLNTEILL